MSASIIRTPAFLEDVKWALAEIAREKAAEKKAKIASDNLASKEYMSLLGNVAGLIAFIFGCIALLAAIQF